MVGVVIGWLIIGCVVGFGFFRKMDSILLQSPDKHGNKSIDELLRHQAKRHDDGDQMQFSFNYLSLKVSTIVVTTVLWPIFAIALLWMLTWT